MKILITGAGGFIGNALVQRLIRCHGVTDIYAITRTPRVWDESKVTPLYCDFSDDNWLSVLDHIEVDVVIHLAQAKNYRGRAEGNVDLLQLNVVTTLRLVEWAQKVGVKKFVFTSTGNVYSDVNKVHSETDLCHPASIYGASKLSAEALLKAFSYSMDVVILRLFAIYGAEQREALIPNIISRYLDGEEIFLASGIGLLINPVHVTDCCEYISKALKLKVRDRFEIINICGKKTIDLQQLTETMQSLTSKDACITITSERPKYLQGSNTKMLVLLGDCETTPFSDGFREVFRYLEAKRLEQQSVEL